MISTPGLAAISLTRTVDRFDWPDGAHLGADRLPFAGRARLRGSALDPYFRYALNDHTTLALGYRVEQSRAAPWFHQPGTEIQYRFIAPDEEALIEPGYLTPVGVE